MFYASDDLPVPPVPQNPAEGLSAQATNAMSPLEFENLARRVLSDHFSTGLSRDQIRGVSKTFDFVSADGRLVGDAKYFTLVRGVSLPPAKFSVIAEHVWLLEKTGAAKTFLVFGNERMVPTQWLKRYGNLVSKVEFYFLTNSGELETLSVDQTPGD